MVRVNGDTDAVKKGFGGKVGLRRRGMELGHEKENAIYEAVAKVEKDYGFNIGVKFNPQSIVFYLKKDEFKKAAPFVNAAIDSAK